MVRHFSWKAEIQFGSFLPESQIIELLAKLVKLYNIKILESFLNIIMQTNYVNSMYFEYAHYDK